LDDLRRQHSLLHLKLQESERSLAAKEKELQSASEELDRVRRSLSPTYVANELLWVPPGHFYSPIPSISDMKSSETEIFDFPPAIRGVELNEAQQVELLEQFGKIAADQPFPAEKTPDRRFFLENPAYSYSDAIVLFAMIRHLRPRRIVEIGSGHSSAAMLDTNELFFNSAIDCTFIDPYPHLLRSLLKEQDHQRVRILGLKVQNVDENVFRELQASDILFVDSSHIAKTGSDVNYIFFKILPLLAEGVYIHFHDIFYPFEYPQHWAFEGRSWNESYFLRAFLQYNDSFKVRFFTTYLMHYHRALFEASMPLCVKNTGGAIWLEKTRHDPRLNRIDARSNRSARLIPRKIDPSRLEDREFLGEGWFNSEHDHCWMGTTAVLRMAGPTAIGEKVVIEGHGPYSDGASLSVKADTLQLGSFRLREPGPFRAEFPLPPDLIGRSEMFVELAVDRTYHPPGDIRELGISVNLIEII
jgi:hypothetical protein